MEGVFPIYKPIGPTSFKIISELRKITGIRRIGHAGTLDPQGRQLAGESDGFYYPGLPDLDANEPTLKPLTMLLDRVGAERMLTLLPGDQHENSDAFDRNARSTTVLDPDLSKLSERERPSSTPATWTGWDAGCRWASGRTSSWTRATRCPRGG